MRFGSLVFVLFSFFKMGGPQQSSELLSRVIQIGHMTVTLIIVDLLFQALSATLRILSPLLGAR